MKSTTLAGIATLSAVVLAFPGTHARADGPAIAASADEITQTLRGRICTSKVGAAFTFGHDGRYAYDGLWKNGGEYVIDEGAVTITFDSGLKRAFAVSRHGDVFYMEETALRCPGAKPRQS
jgi:hypothetical protein